jgi:hypothetical protein
MSTTQNYTRTQITMLSRIQFYFFSKQTRPRLITSTGYINKKKSFRVKTGDQNWGN